MSDRTNTRFPEDVLRKQMVGIERKLLARIEELERRIAAIETPKGKAA